MKEPMGAVTLAAVDYDPFSSVELARVAPSTESQREIWLASKLSSEASLAYNESVSLHLRGTLDRQALLSSLQALIDRHDALRITLSSDGQSLYFTETLAIDIPWIDLNDLSTDAKEDTCTDALRRAVETPFDLETGPLVRIEVLALSTEHHLLLLTAHHIVCDGWSFGVLSTDLMKLYAQHAGQDASLDNEAPSYAQYAIDQTDIDHAKTRGIDTDYWVSVFDRSVPMLELPTDHARKPIRGFASRREDEVLDAKLVGDIRKLGASQGASLFVTLFAMFAALLSRLSGGDEIVVGVPAANQPAEGLPSLVGHCVNLLPIRVATDLTENFQTHLSASNTSVLDAYDHQQCTYGTLLKKLQVKRDLARLPLVSVLFNLDVSIEASALSAAGLNVELSSNPRHFENFDLFLNASQVNGDVVLECQYNRELFTAETVRRWLILYRIALERVVADAMQPLARVLAPTPEDSLLLAAFNGTESAWPSDKRIETLFAQQVSKSPDEIAVTSGSKSLTYRELNARANALALHLRKLGVAPNHLIGLSCGRNEHMLVGLLGILKSGAGYIPLDPAFPQDRLEFMASDAGLSHVVCDQTVSDSLRLRSAERVILDDLGTVYEDPSPLGDASNVAYVIYTSGSTGRPKGVLVPHRTVTNLLESVRKEPGMTARHAVLSVTTLSFDIAVCEVILPLTVGARIVIADREQATNGENLRLLIESQQVNFISATPSTWRLLVDSGWKGSQQVTAICTGEPLPPDLGRQILPLSGSLWNGYGPTETTVWSSFHKVETIDGPVPIGHPVANTSFHVLDAGMQPLPIGVIGELYIGGSGVSLGYLGRPDLTAERFLPDPLKSASRELWYKTGDLGRWRNDGVLECLGRSDHQVKVRGYRIELGEIESALLTHPDIERAIVITREDNPGDVRLVAYVVGRSGVVVDILTLQSHLRITLPDYMVPQHVVHLVSIPLLPNGKMDRNALPVPNIGATLISQDRLTARTPLEQDALTAMEQVLNLPGFGIRDDFFALGGHSLLAAGLTALLNKQHGITLQMRTIFEAPTAEKLAAAIDRALASGTLKRIPIARNPNRSSAPLTPMQERIRFVEELRPGRVIYNTPSAHRLTGPMDIGKFEQAFREIVRRQPALRTSISEAPQTKGYRQSIADSLDFSFPYEDLTSIPEAGRDGELMRRMQAIVDKPIDIYQAPLFRTALYKIADNQHAFLFMPHHIIWDGWSFDLLYKEMSVIYGAILDNRTLALPPLAVDYSDYAYWHSDWMQSEQFDTQLQYWKNRFSKAPFPKALRTDKPRQIGMTGEGAAEWVRLNKATTERLRDIARTADSTLNMLTMAVFSAMMASVANDSSVVIGVPVRGRAEAELEPVMGFFNNLLPVQLKIDSTRPFLDFIRHIKNELLEVFSHQDVPFERLAMEPEVSSRSQRSGLYQALFSFQDARGRMRQWGDLSHKSILIFQRGATEDLGLWLMEVPDGLEGGFTYNADLYTPTTASAFRDRYAGLLEKVSLNPAMTLAELIDVQDSESGKYLLRFSEESNESRESEAGVVSTRAGEVGNKHTITEKEVANIWASLLDIQLGDISAGDRFFALGGSSLQAMQLVAQLEKQFSKKVELNDLVRDLSLREFALAMRPSIVPESLVLIREGSGAPIFFVHDGVGETLLYRNLAMLLDRKHAVYVLQPHSSRDHPILHTRISDMARYHVQMIQRVQAHGPYLLSGLCAGGVIAHEIAIQLQKQGEVIAMVGLMDAADVAVEKRFARVTKNRWKRFKSAIGADHSLLRDVFTVLKKAKNLVTYIVVTFLRKIWLNCKLYLFRHYVDKGLAPPSFLKNLSVAEVYQFALMDQNDRDVLKGDVALFRATAGTQMQEDVPYVELFSDPFFGWKSRVDGTVHCFDVPGGHTSMLQEPNVQVLAEQMQNYINLALRGIG